MRQNRSADPWSAFLDPSDRGTGSPTRHLSRAYTGDERPARSTEVDLPAASRRVVGALNTERGPLTVEQLHERLGLTMLEIADAVRALRGRGMVGIGRIGDEDVVRLTDGPIEQPG